MGEYDIKPWWLTLRVQAGLAALLLFLALAYLGARWEKCTSHGGAYVRGLLGYECVARPSSNKGDD